MSSEKTRPVHEIRLGRIKVAIWENEAQNVKSWQNGAQSTTFYSVTIVRLYKDGPLWKNTTSFGRDDLPLVAKVVDQAHSWIFEQSQTPNGSRDNGSSDVSQEEF